jgi:ABC-type enterobactin transport system permease subunit
MQHRTGLRALAWGTATALAILMLAMPLRWVSLWIILLLPIGVLAMLAIKDWLLVCTGTERVTRRHGRIRVSPSPPSRRGS